MNRPASTRRQLLAAISSMDRRVTIPDVVAKTGLPLAVVSTALNDLAYELRADLDVTDTGQIYYRFPRDLHYRYFSNRLLEIAYRAWLAVAPILFFLFRISFGLVLLFSICLVFLIMLLLHSLGSVFSGNTNDVLALIKEFISMMKRLNIKELGFKRGEQEEGVPASDRGFLLNCHELLFGPPDPNRNFENEKSKAVAQLIRDNDGIILPEQLAPFTGSSATELEGAFPMLAKFHGIPCATPTGHLVYKFPEMQEAVLSPFAADRDGASTDLREERFSKVMMKPCVFADIGMESIKPILLVATSNFLGTFFFWWLLFAIRSSESETESLFLLLAIYATFFLVFPAFRWTYVQLKNISISKYNAKINQLESVMLEPTENLKLAMREVDKMREDEVAHLTDKLAYTTSRDNLEQEAEHFLTSADTGTGGDPGPGKADA